MPQSVVVNGPFNNSTIQDQMLWLHETMKLHIEVDVPNSIHYFNKTFIFEWYLPMCLGVASRMNVKKTSI